ncbi:MAG: hypothetical protein N2170_00820 [Bacteroidia bacterium]|nr:hypothetical protein [Bacteroidia bacterium]
MAAEPVLLLVYNRLDTLKRVWDVLRRVKPRILFISADGPKSAPEDVLRTEAVRKFVQSQIDWPCDAYFNFLSENEGCKRAVSGGITWFFSHVKAGIILEDDTLPHPSFFTYMHEMLARYADDSRVGMVSGTQLQPGFSQLSSGWDFIRIPFIWGWGTWQRVWSTYQAEPVGWEELKDSALLENRVGSLRSYVRFLWKAMAGVTSGAIDTWDYQLSYLLLREGQLCVIPEQNLVRNLGHAHPLATHTRKGNWTSYLPLQRWRKGKGPLCMQPNTAYERHLMLPHTLAGRIRARLQYYRFRWGLQQQLVDDPFDEVGI